MVKTTNWSIINQTGLGPGIFIGGNLGKRIHKILSGAAPGYMYFHRGERQAFRGGGYHPQ